MDEIRADSVVPPLLTSLEISGQRYSLRLDPPVCRSRISAAEARKSTNDVPTEGITAAANIVV